MHKSRRNLHTKKNKALLSIFCVAVLCPFFVFADVAQRNVAGRSVSRAISTGTGTNNNSRTSTGTRAVASSPRNAQQTQRGIVSRTAKTQSVSARSSGATRSRATVSARSTTNATRTSATSKPVTARVAATGNVISGTRTNSGTPGVLTDSGDPLYISNSARVGTNRRSTTARNSSVVGASTPIITPENISETTSTLDALAELTDYCKAQYAQCMDNYCNVLDDNQGRCSCSGNISKYEKTEKSLADLSESFQDVVQKIKYIGLTASQIEALFAETEAELAMKSNSDTSVLKNSLDNIKKKIIDVTSGKSTSTGLLDGLSFDMSGLLDTDFSAGLFDLNSFLGNSKVSNQRGTSLFNTATQRCKTAVLNSCVAQGIDANVVINSYDLAIDKQCIEYERSLNEANNDMRNNVRNAQNILQQARLLLAQQKNAYDLRGCVAALDECMQDEYVCGDDYELCLDPTGKYLANGEIVKGGIPGVAGGSSVNQDNVTDTNITSWLSCGMYGLYKTWDYEHQSDIQCTTTVDSSSTTPYHDKNAWGKGTNENLNAYITEKLENWEHNYEYNKSKDDKDDIATYLLRRVGYIDAKNDKSYGMCANVLKQCQDYTYETKGSSKQYLVNNEVVRQYLALALTKIKLKQDTILSDYAETCWNDVYSCLSANNYDENNTNTTASKTAVNACRGDIATCMSVTGYYPNDNTTLTLAAMTDWVASIILSVGASGSSETNNSGTSQTGILGPSGGGNSGDSGSVESCTYTKTAANCTSGWHPSTDKCTRNGVEYIKECIANTCDSAFNKTTACGSGYDQTTCQSGNTTNYKCTPTTCSYNTTSCASGYVETGETCQSGETLYKQCAPATCDGYTSTMACGDGYIQETCQSGNTTKYKCTSCTFTTPAASCISSNGLVPDHEQCTKNSVIYTKQCNYYAMNLGYMCDINAQCFDGNRYSSVKSNTITSSTYQPKTPSVCGAQYSQHKGWKCRPVLSDSYEWYLDPNKQFKSHTDLINFLHYQAQYLLSDMKDHKQHYCKLDGTPGGNSESELLLAICVPVVSVDGGI